MTNPNNTSTVRYFVYDNRDKCISSQGFESLEKAIYSAVRRGGNTVKMHSYYRDPERNDKLYPDGDPVVVWNATHTVTKHPVQVCFVNLGEGYNGDYDSSDPDDQYLLRLDLKEWDAETEQYEDSESVCTCMASTTEEEVKQKTLEALADMFYEDSIAHNGPNTRLLIGRASYISDDNIQEYVERTAQMQVRRIAYERFQFYWLATHGFSMRDVFKAAQDWAQELHDEMLTSKDYTLEASIEDHGFDQGSLYPGYWEFLGEEYCIPELMKLLLNESLLCSWEKDPIVLAHKDTETATNPEAEAAGQETRAVPSTSVLRVVEENVDGCGSDAVMYVGFSRSLTPKIQERFQGHLRAVKGRADACDLDTEEMVNEAIEGFNESVCAKALDVQAEICDAPYFGVATF